MVLWTRCSPLPVVVAFVAEKPLVATTEWKIRTNRLAVATIESLSTEVLRLQLQPIALL